jgi:hypothetical protein
MSQQPGFLRFDNGHSFTPVSRPEGQDGVLDLMQVVCGTGQPKSTSGRACHSSTSVRLPIQAAMPPLYRKLKALQLRQEYSRDQRAFLRRYREAIAGLASDHAAAVPSIERLIDAILASEEAEQSTSAVMRAIAA